MSRRSRPREAVRSKVVIRSRRMLYTDAGYMNEAVNAGDGRNHPGLRLADTMRHPRPVTIRQCADTDRRRFRCGHSHRVARVTASRRGARQPVPPAPPWPGPWEVQVERSDRRSVGPEDDAARIDRDEPVDRSGARQPARPSWHLDIVAEGGRNAIGPRC